MRNSLARRVLWVHVILLLALCGVLLRIFVIKLLRGTLGSGERKRKTGKRQHKAHHKCNNCNRQ